MKKILVPVILPALMGIGATCYSSHEPIAGGTSKLQEQWTSDMRVSYYHGGGMVNTSKRIDISSDSAVYELHEEQLTQRYRLNYTRGELDTLAKTFYDNDFANIKLTQKVRVYDAATTNISICVGKACYHHGNGPGEIYTDKNKQRMRNVVEKILSVADQKLEALKVPIAVTVDGALLKGKDVLIYHISGGVFFSTETQGRSEREAYSILPGRFKVSASMVVKDSSGTAVYQNDCQQMFSTQEGNTVVISKTNGKLNIGFKNL